MPSPGEHAAALGFRAGWAGVQRLPEPVAYAAFDRIAIRAYRRNGSGVRHLRRNYATVRPELGHDALERLVQAGMRSYLRYYCDAFRLPRIAGNHLFERLRLVDAEEPFELVGRGEPVVGFLGHLGNWDLAGAWSVGRFPLVTTVAERLRPEALYRQFLDFRESLGMRILPLTGGRPPFPQLRDAIAAGGFVPLLADRDLSSRGVTVQLAGHSARFAVGPARLALDTGAALFPLALTYEPVPSRPWHRVVAHFGPRVDVPAEGSPAQRAAAMTQACADFLGAKIVSHTQDWHMMQRVFVEAPHDRVPV